MVSDVVEYKSKIMNKLCSLSGILELINNPNVKEPINLKNTNIFSYMKIPDTQLNVKNYICFNYNSKLNYRNETLKILTINIAVVCHESEIDTPMGNRHDVLAGVITEELIWSDLLGFELKLISDTENVLNGGYHIRDLQFQNLASNSGGKIDGY